MGRDLVLILTGAGIAMGSSLITAVTQHFLGLRAERIRRQMENEERANQEIRNRLLEGTDIHLAALKDQVSSESEWKKLFVILCCSRAATPRDLEFALQVLRNMKNQGDEPTDPDGPPLLSP